MPRSPARTAPLFRALLKHFRSTRGMSQLDLAVSAEVSGRHISFLETGRAQPSRDMILRLATTLGLGLRDQNELLVAAGFSPLHPESNPDAPLDPSVERIIQRMLEQQEPYPMAVLNRHHDILRMNSAAGRVFMRFVADPEALGERPNTMRMVFDPRLMRPYLQRWPHLARVLLASLQREALAQPHDGGLRGLVAELLSYPDVPSDWQLPDLATAESPVLTFYLKRDDLQLGFWTTLTVFNTPQDVTLQELRLESYFPADLATERRCRELSVL